MKALEVTDRIKAVREQYLGLPVRVNKKRNAYYTHDRWLTMGFLRGWLENEDALTTQLRRSLAEASELDAAEPVIYENELILGHLYLPEYEGEELAEYEKLCEMFKMSPSSINTELYRARPDHIGLDYETLIKCGVNGLIERIEQKKNGLCPESGATLIADKTLCQEEFYDCCLIELKSVLRLAGRYADCAEKMAQCGGARGRELAEMAEILRRVPAEPAKTFREALQSMHFFTFNLFGLYPLGRPDRLLYDYYKRDIEAGILTRELAQELIDSYCLLISDYTFHRAASGFIVGGRTADGSVVENELTYMFLTALDHIRMPDPNGALAVCSDTSDELMEYAVEIVSKGVTHPAFYNDDAITSSLIKYYNVKPEDAYDYIHTTCAEISVIGKTRAYTTCYVTFLSETVKEVVFEHSDYGMDEIFAEIERRLRIVVNTENRKYAMKVLEASRIGQQPMRVSCLIDDCIERGESVYQNGARYNFLQPIFIGFSNAVDSLMAIQKLVFEEKRMSLEEFSQIVKADFAQNEALRAYIVNKLPHYGNDNDEVDNMAERLAGIISGIFKDKSVYLSDFSMPGTFSYDMHSCGERFGAGFDGRRAGTSFADGCCPCQGRDTNGPTAMIKSMTSWDQSDYLAGMVVNMKFAKSTFDEGRRSKLLQLIKTFISRGGIETQINIVDRQTLLDAQINPEQHEDLLVRIGGYSDYFVKQNAVMQQEIIERTEH